MFFIWKHKLIVREKHDLITGSNFLVPYLKKRYPGEIPNKERPKVSPEVRAFSNINKGNNLNAYGIRAAVF